MKSSLSHTKSRLDHNTSYNINNSFESLTNDEAVEERSLQSSFPNTLNFQLSC